MANKLKARVASCETSFPERFGAKSVVSAAARSSSRASKRAHSASTESHTRAHRICGALCVSVAKKFGTNRDNTKEDADSDDDAREESLSSFPSFPGKSSPTSAAASASSTWSSRDVPEILDATLVALPSRSSPSSTPRVHSRTPTVHAQRSLVASVTVTEACSPPQPGWFSWSKSRLSRSSVRLCLIHISDPTRPY